MLVMMVGVMVTVLVLVMVFVMLGLGDQGGGGMGVLESLGAHRLLRAAAVRSSGVVQLERGPRFLFAWAVQLERLLRTCA